MLNQLQDFTPQATHLDNSPVTKVSPPKSAFPKSNTGDEQKFNIICEELKDTPGLQLADKKPIEWDKRDPLHFWQSLALVLRSEDLVCIAVSSFVDKEGQNKLYFASNRQMNDAQKEDIRDITSMFMELQPEEEIAYRVFPRQLPYIIKQFNKIYVEQTKVFEAEVPSPLGEIAKEIQNLKQKVEAKAIVPEDFSDLLGMIWKNKDILGKLKDSAAALKEIKRVSYHLCKMVRFYEEILFVHKTIKRHRDDPAFKSLSKTFHFVHDNCHAELAILKAAKDCCTSKTLYIGVSKRPCYCCSLFIKAVEANNKVPFKISIVTTHGKLYGWTKMSNEDFFNREFEQVWAKAIQDYNSRKKRLQQQTDDNSSESGSSTQEQAPIKDFPDLKKTLLKGK